MSTLHSLKSATPFECKERGHPASTTKVLATSRCRDCPHHDREIRRAHRHDMRAVAGEARAPHVRRVRRGRAAGGVDRAARVAEEVDLPEIVGGDQ
eukprot:scaffold73037_cov63-Phaeocystis_antarctica.AAC.1